MKVPGVLGFQKAGTLSQYRKILCTMGQYLIVDRMSRDLKENYALLIVVGTGEVSVGSGRSSSASEFSFCSSFFSGLTL